jgi:hypothetical protein
VDLLLPDDASHTAEGDHAVDYGQKAQYLAVGGTVGSGPERSAAPVSALVLCVLRYVDDYVHAMVLFMPAIGAPKPQKHPVAD